MGGELVMGAVAYDPKVVTIWEGFRRWFSSQGFPFDFVLYSNYERQAEDLVEGRIQAAWSSPLAWVRTRRLAAAAGTGARALVMRDTDRDLTSVVVTRSGSGVTSLEDLRGAVLGVGAVDSPQARLLPLSLLRHRGIDPDADLTVRSFEVGVGLHGDHVGGERDAARALVAGEVAATCMIDGNHLAFGREGTLPSGTTTVIAQTELYDHCNMTVLDAAPSGLVERFGELLLSMSYADEEVRALLDLEGLRQWVPGRTTGYAALEAAVDEAAFYGADGAVTAAGYVP